MALMGLLARDEGSVAVEYVVFVAAVGIILIVGVAALFNSMSGLFEQWATYFNSTS
jgi:Flp pilus assembly pilin Flp